jgi:hypothetical protein
MVTGKRLDEVLEPRSFSAAGLWPSGDRQAVQSKADLDGFIQNFQAEVVFYVYGL